ncbi:MAG: putative ABC exporter domain-containing protein [Verrucomicrobiota bacterium]
MNALGYLVTRSFVNGVLFRLRRLRQPKYLLGAILGAAYFYFYFGRFLAVSRMPWGAESGPASPHGLEIGAAILFVATIVLSWILPASRAAIAFTEAEIAFLFPAPISRRTLVIMRLVKSQAALLLFSAFMTLLSGRFRFDSEAWLRIGGWWVIMNTLNMHRLGASFALQRLRERGMGDGKRRVIVVLAIMAFAAFVEFMRRSLPPPPDLATAMSGRGEVMSYIVQVLQTGPLHYVLAPFKLVVAPNFAHDAMTFLRALLPAFGIMALHFIWVVRADVSFEDASIEAAKKRAAFLAARGRGELRARGKSDKARTPLWRLHPTGFAPFAFVWKSLLKSGGRRTLGRWAIFFALLAAGAWALQIVSNQHTGNPQKAVVVTAFIIGGGCYIALLISFVMIGQHSAAQLRQGIAAMDLLKTYPIPGWQIALGELAGPVLLGSLMQWCSLGIGLMLLSIAPPLHSHLGIIAAIAGGIALLLPIFNLSTAILPCAGALLFPGWFRPQESAGPGLENTGMKLILGIAQLLAVVVAMIPVVFFGAVAWFAFGKITMIMEWRALAAGGTAMLILAMETGLGIAWLGSLYDNFDVSSES